MKRKQADITFDDAGFINGCLPQDEASFAMQAACMSGAVPYSSLYNAGKMPVFSFDGDFVSELKRREAVIADINRENLGYVLPHNVHARLFGNQPLYFSQGKLGSCCGHAFGFAYASSLLTNIGLRSVQTYRAINPIGTYVLSHGGRLKNGQNVAVMAKYCNEQGNYLCADIGTDNQRIPKFTDAARQSAAENESGICFLPDAAAVLQTVRGGIAVTLGNSLAVSGGALDANGMPVAELGGRWEHATHFAGWVRKNGNDYYLWINSHGKKYKPGTLGETGDGLWMTEKTARRFLESSERYGDPAAVIAEGRRV